MFDIGVFELAVDGGNECCALIAGNWSHDEQPGNTGADGVNVNVCGRTFAAAVIVVV